MEKQENALVSIVVPVYNVEKYLSRCIDSILAQTYQNFELILVDDGSPDNCGAICDDYASKDSRITVIHQENSGVSRARNAGIERARGEYLFFVDSDDWVDPEHIEKLLPIGDEDLVSCGFMRFVDGQQYDCITPVANVFTYSDWIDDFWNFWITNAILPPWRSCYKQKIIQEHKLRFNGNLQIGEDEHFNLQYFMYCKKMKFTNQHTYFYEIGGHPSAMRKFHPTRLDSAIAISRAIEEIAKKPEYRARWYHWHGAIRHMNKWKRQNCSVCKKDMSLKLRECYANPFFRECIPYIRKHGSLDEKIESYFMSVWAHPLYKPFYSIIIALSTLKHAFLKRK